METAGPHRIERMMGSSFLAWFASRLVRLSSGSLVVCLQVFRLPTLIRNILSMKSMTSENDDQIRHYENKLAYEIDSWDLSVAIDSGVSIVVVDARSADAHHAKHIPGSINIPHRTMSPETTSAIDRNATVVTYCDGIGCNASTKGAINLARMGFKVRELIGGLDWWIRDGHPVQTSTPPNSTPFNNSTRCGCD